MSHVEKNRPHIFRPFGSPTNYSEVSNRTKELAKEPGRMGFLLFQIDQYGTQLYEELGNLHISSLVELDLSRVLQKEFKQIFPGEKIGTFRLPLPGIFAMLPNKSAYGTWLIAHQTQNQYEELTKTFTNALPDRPLTVSAFQWTATREELQRIGITKTKEENMLITAENVKILNGIFERFLPEYTRDLVAARKIEGNPFARVSKLYRLISPFSHIVSTDMPIPTKK